MSRRDRQRVENPLGNTRFSAKAYLYLLPAFAVLGVFVFYPIVKTLRMGFYESYVYLTDTGKGLGLASFAYVLKDPAFRSGAAEHPDHCGGGRAHHHCAGPWLGTVHQLPPQGPWRVPEPFIFCPM